jgi:peptidoglycan hydrolase FlgJ
MTSAPRIAAVGPAELRIEQQSELRPETASPARAAREFESLFLAELLKRAHKPMFEDGLLSGGSAGAMYRDWFADEIAQRMAAAGGLGLAKAIAQSGAVSPPGSER